MFKNLMLLFILLLPFIQCTQSIEKEAKSTSQFIHEMDQKVPKLLNDFSVPGAAIAIIEDGEVVLQKGYGFSNVEKNIKVTKSTGFNIASISKTIAAWGIMKLVQDGKIDLDAPAEQYLTKWHLPESAFNSVEVTIRRLLSHTAGLSLHGYPGWSPEDELPTIEESLNGKNNGPGRVEIILKPGSKYQYSGGGFSILQLIMEEVTGQKFEDYMQNQILAPIGMINSSFKIDNEIMAASSNEYDDYGEKIDLELFTAQAAAGLHTTIEDFTRFALANFYQNKKQSENPILSADILRQMMAPEPVTNGNYGLGYEVDTREMLKGLRGHTGNNAGWHSIFRINPITNDALIVFTNGGLGYNIVNAILCEWVSWKTDHSLLEGCELRKPISNILKQVIDEKGIENVERTYLKLKKEQADKYNFSSSQLNNLGYYYMSQKMFAKASTIFKLNVEAYPEDYNVYDSYGEALLAMGLKEGAIEYYKKSVVMNPANSNGVGVLNELGISNDDIVNQITIRVDEQILIGYLGQYKSAHGETLTIQKKGHYLNAEIQQQSLSLSAESTTRFQAIGDEAIITFFTAATGQKGLWVNEKIWTKNSVAFTDRKVSPNSQHAANKNIDSDVNFLLFRNNPSWDRQTDFEHVLEQTGCQYMQSTSKAMKDLNLSIYDVIIIPGRQNKTFYEDYSNSEKRFDEFISKGGTLLLELNGAESSTIKLPRKVQMIPSKGFENKILAPNHPIFLPFFGKSIMRARYTSSSYLQNIPNEAVILAIESEGEEVFTDRPTFIEYPCGKGQVIAACQCFHDRDGSGRGPLMESVISYSYNKSLRKSTY